MSENQNLPNSTSPETKSSNSVIESGKINSRESLKRSNKSISKKQLAKRLIASAVIAANMGIPADHSPVGTPVDEPRGVTQELSLQDLEKRAETLYQIQIISPEELPEIDVSLEKGKESLLKTFEWAGEDIVGLTLAFDSLPPHFPSPSPLEYRLSLASLAGLPESSIQLSYEVILDDLKKKLGEDFFLSREDYDRARERGYFSHTLGLSPKEFILVDPREFQDIPGWIGRCLCGNRGPDDQQKILLDYRLFKYESRIEQVKTVAHELIHSIDTPDDHRFVADLLEVSLDEHEKMKKLLAPNIDRATERFGYDVRKNLIHASTNTNEFLSVGGEVYFEGKERFQEIYGVLIGEEKAERFYNHMRDNIFKGTEYKDYQKIIK